MLFTGAVNFAKQSFVVFSNKRVKNIPLVKNCLLLQNAFDTASPGSAFSEYGRIFVTRNLKHKATGLWIARYLTFNMLKNFMNGLDLSTYDL